MYPALSSRHPLWSWVRREGRSEKEMEEEDDEEEEEEEEEQTGPLLTPQTAK